MTSPQLSRRFFLGAASAAALLPTRSAFAAEKSDVLIIGAGLSGLNAAMILASEGFSVRVLEADARPGGRIRTLDDTELHYDAGGSEVGPLYARTRQLVTDLGLTLTPYIPTPKPGMAIHMGGRLIAPDDWERAPENPLSGDMRRVPPYATSGRLMANAPKLEDYMSWLEPGHPMGFKSYAELLADLGADAHALRYDHVHAPVPETSALFMLRRSHMRSMSRGEGRLDHIKGGMSRLTDAMAASLGEQVHYNARVEGISQSQSGVTVVTTAGERFTADRAIVTLPLTMLGKLKWDMPVDPSLRAAWNQVPYGAATSIFYPVKDPYWEADGLPPNMWSDTLIGRAFMVTNEVGQYVWHYAGGQNAAHTFGWPLKDVVAYATQSLEAARPSLKGRLGDPTAWCWSRHPFSRATFASRKPSDLGTLQARLKAPMGRVAFAGEHSADLAAGIEGALESGERAAIDTLSEMI